MSLKALDHSTRLDDPVAFYQAVKAAGYAAVGRYLPLPPGTLAQDSVGRLTLAEVAAIHGAGLGLFVIYERDTTTYHRPLSGQAGGLVDGPAARSAANALGAPADLVLFGAADFDPTVDQYATIAAYLGAGQFEPYANGPLCSYLSVMGFTHSWMHNWGGAGYSDPHIHQQGGQVTVAGVNCDLNDVYYTDCIWWPPASQPVPQPQPVHFEEDNVTKIPLHVPMLDDQGNGNIPIPGVAGRVVAVSMNGNDPNHEGYPRIPKFAWSDRGSDVLLVITEGLSRSPGFDINAWVVG